MRYIDCTLQARGCSLVRKVETANANGNMSFAWLSVARLLLLPNIAGPTTSEEYGCTEFDDADAVEPTPNLFA